MCYVTFSFFYSILYSNYKNFFVAIRTGPFSRIFFLLDFFIVFQIQTKNYLTHLVTSSWLVEHHLQTSSEASDWLHNVHWQAIQLMWLRSHNFIGKMLLLVYILDHVFETTTTNQIFECIIEWCYDWFALIQSYFLSRRKHRH